MNKTHLNIILFFFSIMSGDVYSEALRDPTRPLGFHSGNGSGQQSLDLQAIFSSERSRPKAIVNGELLSVGDSLVGWQLLAIGDGNVTFRNDGVTKVLYLRSAVTK